MANSQATEQQILKSFLLSRAPLEEFVSLKQYTELFPKEKRNNPQIKLLYRELQVLRNRQCDRIEKNIVMEARLGARQRKELKQRGREERTMDTDIMEGIELYGAPPTQPRLTLVELLEQMENAVTDQDEELSALDINCTELYKQMDTIVGDMSDLRYGKLPSSGSVDQIGRQLKIITDICDHVLNPDIGSNSTVGPE
ncbi:Cnl2/NKP2 family protein-domain-containing protein [Geopyxis carbonaria]|nr:Cnl2/NKP2 family protein-domain-containing protein [Geopyxis carbonaria]